MVYGEKIWILLKYFGYYMWNKYHSPEFFWHDFILHFTTMFLTEVFNSQPKYRNWYNIRGNPSTNQSYGFPSSHVQMWELDHKGWELKTWSFWTVGLEKTLESPLDNKKIKRVNPKANQLWTVIGRTDAEAEAPTLWPPNAKSWLTGKAPDAGEDWGQEEKGVTEDEMVGWHHWLNGCKF